MAERIFKGGEFLVTEVTCDEIFTPEEFTDEQKQIAETTEQFVENEIVPHIDEIEDQNFDLVIEAFKKCGDLGLLMMDTPEAYGGMELDKVTSMLVAEKIAPAGGFSVAYAAHTGIGTLPLIYYGTEAQKEQYLPKLVSGEWPAAYCLTEPGSGSDALGARASAILSEDGTHYILNGTKQFISGAGYNDIYVVMVRTNDNGAKGITCLVVEKDTPGLSFGAPEKKLGWNASPTAQVIFEDCRVPVANRVGAEGDGFRFAMAGLDGGRLNIGACSLGGAQRCLDEAIKYTKDRQQFGQAVADFQNTQFTLADMATDLEAARALLYLAAAKVNANAPDKTRISAMAKRLSTDSGSEIVNKALQLFGGAAFAP